MACARHWFDFKGIHRSLALRIGLNVLLYFGKGLAIYGFKLDTIY